MYELGCGSLDKETMETIRNGPIANEVKALDRAIRYLRNEIKQDVRDRTSSVESSERYRTQVQKADLPIIVDDLLHRVGRDTEDYQFAINQCIQLISATKHVEQLSHWIQQQMSQSFANLPMRLREPMYEMLKSRQKVLQAHLARKHSVNL